MYKYYRGKWNTSLIVIGYLFCCVQQPCRTIQQGGTNEFPIIWTSYGPIKGQKFISPWTNETIYSFKGIPYATPPIGELRFQDPEPAGKWSQVRDATREGPVCPQPVPNIYLPPGAAQSEDCLFLNVYTPKLYSRQNELLPVMVFLHGGVFHVNSGNYRNNGPDFLVAQDIVFVSINYRLAALGFLNLGIPGAGGNAGLKDQRLALLWVQSEIRHFGGDPQRVTLFGQSAGAMSCHFHYTSPLSVGLFHRAIADSGAAISYHDGVRVDGAVYGMRLAELLNCSTGGDGDGGRHPGYWREVDPPPLPGVVPPLVDPAAANLALQCLRAADWEDIVAAQEQVKDPLGEITGLEVFAPTIDRHSSKEPFLPDFPFKLLDQKKHFFVPFLTGVNSDEGIIRLYSNGGEEINNVTNNYKYMYGLQVPQSCNSMLKTEKMKHVYNKYNHPEPYVKGYVDVYTDVLYAYGTCVTARKYQHTANLFLYYFSFNGSFKNPFIAEVETKYQYSGVPHMEELSYLFIQEGVNQKASYNSNEMKTLRRMVKMWTNFVKYGSPTVGPDPLLQNVQWLPASGGRTNHLNIDVDLSMTSEDILAPRAALWDSITFNHCL